MFYWIYDYPSWLIGSLFSVVSVGVTSQGFSPLVQSSARGFTVSAAPTTWSASLSPVSRSSTAFCSDCGLLAVTAYQNFSSVTDVVTKEASNLASLYRDLQGYPEPVRSDLRDKLREYTRYVIEDGWPEQRKGIVPSGGSERVPAFFNGFIAFKPQEKSEEIVHAEALRQFNAYIELRRERLANVTTGIPAVLWWVVAIGAVLNVAFVWLLDMEIHVHLILGGIVSLFLWIVIFLIAALDNPFRGEVSVGPDAFQLVYNSTMKPTSSPK